MNAKHRCPRRCENPHAGTMFPEDDTWREGEVPTCSYCGSIESDYLMDRLEKGTVQLGPTDKNYKAYVDATEGSQPIKVPGASKFYFQHLNDEQRKRFVELANDKKLNIGYPGHFYSLPFFMQIIG